MVGTIGALPQPISSAAFLGQGVSYPLALDTNTGRLKLSSGPQSVSEALQGIMQTPPGERPMQPDFGGDVGTFEPPDPGLAQAHLDQNLADHEPRVRSAKVDVILGPTSNDVTMSIEYQLVGQANSQLLTYPYFQGPS